MSTKSGYSRIIAVMQRQGTKASNSGGLILAKMKSAKVANYKGIDLKKDEDFSVVKSPWKHKHTASSSDGAGITVSYNDDDKDVNVLKAGDIVLMYDTGSSYILIGKVV
jgi:hypothetical protein